MLNIENWNRAELPFAANAYNGLSGSTVSHIVPRHERLCLTAVHAVNHYRYGAFKKADRRTGGLVEMLGENLGISTATHRQRKEEIEPSTAPTQIEKFLLSNHHKYVLDIHAAKPDNDFDLCIGTGPGGITTTQHELITEIEKAAHQQGLVCALNRPHYSALIAPAMTRRLKEQGQQNIIQIELNASILQGDSTDRLLYMFALLAARLQAS